MVRRGSLAPPGHYAPLGPALRVNSKALNCFLQHESEGGNHDAATALASRSTLAKRQPPYGFFTATAATHAPTHAAHSRQSCVTLPPIDDWDGRDPFERSGLSSSTTSTTSCSTTDRPRSAGFFGWLHSRHTQALETHEAAERSELTAIEYDVRDIVLTALAMSVSLGASESVSRYNLCIAERVGFDRITDRGAATRKAVHLLLYNQNSALILFFSALRKYAFDAVRKRRLLRQYDALHGASEVALRCRTLRVLGRYAERCVAMRQLRAALVEEETTQRGVVTAAEAEASSYERYIIRDAKTFLWMTNCRIISVIKTGYSGAVEIREEEALCYAELCGRTTVMQQETDENKVVAFAQEQQRRRTAAMEALSGVSTLSLLTLKYGAWCKWHQLRFNPSTGKGRSKMMALKSTKRILRRWYEVLLSRVMRVRLRAKQSAFALELLFTTETRRLQLAFNTLRLYSFREKAVSLLQHTDQMHLAIFYRKLRRYRRRTDEEIIEDRVHQLRTHIFSVLCRRYYLMLSAWVTRKVKRKLKAVVLLRRNAPLRVHDAYHALLSYRDKMQTFKEATHTMLGKLQILLVRKRFNDWSRYTSMRIARTQRKLQQARTVRSMERRHHRTLRHRYLHILHAAVSAARRRDMMKENIITLVDLSIKRAQRLRYTTLLRYTRLKKKTRECLDMRQAVLSQQISTRFWCLMRYMRRRVRGEEMQLMAADMGEAAERSVLERYFAKFTEWHTSPVYVLRQRSARANWNIFASRYFSKLAHYKEVRNLRLMQHDQAALLAYSNSLLLLSRYFVALSPTLSRSPRSPRTPRYLRG